jgi:hypothetical protein
MREHNSDQDLRNYLEPNQLVADTSRPLPRVPLTPAARAGLWALRGFVIALSGMVIYTFVTQVL